MAKKVKPVQTELENSAVPKKKKSACCSCCAAFIIVCLVITVIAGIAGWVIGDRFLQTRYDIGMSDVVDSFFGLRHYNEKKIVTNSYRDTSEEEVYAALKSALFLKEDTEFDLERLLQYLVAAEDAQAETGAVMQALAAGEEASAAGNTPLIEYLSTVLTYENIDADKLNAYKEAEHGDYILNLTDKETARAMDIACRYLLGSETVAAPLDETLANINVTAEMLKLEDNITVSQVVFYRDGEDARIKLTLCANWRTLSNRIINKADLSQQIDTANGWQRFAVSAGKTAAKGLLAMLTPKKIFFTVDLSVTAGVAPRITVNNASKGEMDNIFKLVKNASGGQTDLKQIIEEPFTAANGAVRKLLTDAAKFQDLTKVVGDGKLSLDIVETGIEAVKLNYDLIDEKYVLKPAERQVHSADVYYGLAAVFGSSAEDVIGENGSKTHYDYNNIKLKFDADGELIIGADGLPEFDYDYQYAAKLAAANKDILDEYKQGLISVFAASYGLKRNIDFDTLLDTFMVGNMNTDTLLELFDAGKLKDVILGTAKGAVISDTMLAAIVSSSMDKFLGQSGDLKDKIELKYIILSHEEEREFMELGIYLKVKELTQGKGGKLAAALLPDGFIFSVKIDITLNAASYLPTEFSVNASEKTAKVVKLLDAFGIFKDDEGNALTTAAYLDKMLLPVRDTLKKMNDTLPGLSLGSSKLMLPNVYTAIASALNAGLEEAKKLNINELAEALKLLVAEMPDNPYAQITPSMYDEYERALLAELENKLALSLKRADGSSYSLSELFEKLGLNGSAGTTEEIIDLISASRLEALIESKTIDGLALTDFASDTDMLVVMLREIIDDFVDPELAAGFGRENVRAVKLVEENGKLRLQLYLTLDLTELIKGENADDATINFLKKLLPQTVLVSCSVDVSAGETHEKTEVVYNMGENSPLLFEVIEKMGVELPFDTIGNNVRTAVDKLRGSDKLALNFVPGAVESEDIFAVLDNLVFESDCSSGEIQSALQGIYKTSNKNIGSFFDGKTVNSPSADYQTFMGEISAKYFLKIETSDFDGLMAVLNSNDNGAINANVFDIDGLTHTKLTRDELSPLMNFGDVGALFKEKLPVGTTITPVSTAFSDNILEIYVEVKLDDYLKTNAGNIDFKKIITVQKFYVRLSLDLSAPQTGANGSYYPATAVINDISEEQFAIFARMVKKYNDDLAASLQNSGAEAGKAVFDSLKTVNDNIPGGCEFSEKGLLFIDPFGFIGKTLAGGATSSELVRQALQGMYISNGVGSSGYNYVEADLIFNPVAATAPVPDQTTMLGGITDSQLGAYVDAALQKTDFGSVRQLSILPAGANTKAVIDDREYLNGFKAGSVDASGTSLVITAEMNTAKMGNIAAGAADIIPSKMFVTFVLRFDETQNEFVYNGFYRINRLSLAAQQTLLELTGIDQAQIESLMNDHSKEAVTPVNELISRFKNNPYMTLNTVFYPSSAGTSRGSYKIEIAA